MKIISKYKDFYDHYAYHYGIDNSITWYRDLIVNEESDLLCQDSSFINLSRRVLKPSIVPKSFKLRYTNKKEFKDGDYLLGAISVLGTVYLVVYRIENGLAIPEKMLTKEFYLENFKDYELSRKYSMIIYGEVKCRYKELLAKIETFNKPLLDLHYKLNVPILTLQFYPNKTVIPNLIPQLGLIKGFVSAIGDTGEFYRTIYNFFINNKSQEQIDLPSEIDNKTKIHKAGFDLKSSFRHPVK